MEVICDSEMSSTFNWQHGVASQKIVLIITIAVRTSTPIALHLFLLNTFNLNIIQDNIFNLTYHVERMEAKRVPKQLMDSTRRGRRSTGRPKLCRKDQPEERNLSKCPNSVVYDDYLHTSVHFLFTVSTAPLGPWLLLFNFMIIYRL
jgi:hypothetical protein